MKKVKNYYGDLITAYQKPDIDELREKGILDKAYRLWLNRITGHAAGAKA